MNVTKLAVTSRMGALDQNYVLEYAWNAASQVTQMKLTIRTQSAKTWDYVYLDDGELDTVTNPDGDVTDHQYLTDGRLKKVVLDSTATREFFYQDTNDSHAYVSDKNTYLRKTLDKTGGGTTICSFAYELDAAGIRRSITDKDGKYRIFTYDPKYQLKSEMLWSAKVPGTRSDALLWTYDGNGNRLTQHDDGVLTDYAYGSNNEMTDAGSDAFTFDNFGNTASIVGVETYSYDFESHMTQREASGGSTDTHEYDGDGQRMRSKLDDAADWTHFIHDELTENLICEYTLIGGTFTIKALNTYGLGLISSNRQGTIRYFHFDGLGTTYHLTDTSQTVTDSYSYDAFGVPISVTGSSVNPYRYVGQWGYYDDGAMGSSSELLLLGVRYYWPRYGRFSVWDGRAYQNRYEYARNEASIAADPSGYDIVYCYRKVVTSAEGHSHPYLRTNLCGVIGLTGSTEGIVIGVLDDPQKGQGYCERVNAGGEDPTCRTLRLSVAQERCICQNAINAKKGWTLCGRRWLAGDYDWYGNNSQHFIIALLMKCTGGGDEIPYFGNRPFNLEDCQ